MKANGLKANELMTGDWVRLVNDYGIIRDMLLCLKPLDICRIWEGTYVVEPIPITGELLEDNSWKHHVLGQIEFWLSPDRRIELRSNKNHDMCNSDAAWSVHIDDENFCSLGSGEVTYLHELQNEFNCKHYQFNWKV